MGQALRKLTEGASRAAPRQSQPRTSDVRVHRPETQPIFEPPPVKEDPNEWDRNNPKYAAMVQQVVGSVVTRPGGTQETGPATITPEYTRPRPGKGQTSAAQPVETTTIVGKLNESQLRELFTLRQGSHSLDDLAKKFNVEKAKLEKLFQFTSFDINNQVFSRKPDDK